MASYGGGGGGQPGKGPWQPAGIPGFPPGAGGGPPPPPVFQAGLPGLAGHLPPGHPGAPNPVVTMAGQPGVYGNPRALGPPGFQANAAAAGHAQILQQQAGALAALQQHQQQQQQLQQQAKQGQGQQTRVFTGIVTKYVGPNSGFVDNEVFFQTKDVKGPIPKENDRVLVEAYYNATMPFKWNASSLQLMPGTLPGSGPGGPAAGGGGQPQVRPQAPPPPVSSHSAGLGGLGGGAMTAGNQGQRGVAGSTTLNTHAFGGGGPPPQMQQPPKPLSGGGGGFGGHARGASGSGNLGRQNVSDNSKMGGGGGKSDRSNDRGGRGGRDTGIGRIGDRDRDRDGGGDRSSRDRGRDSRDRDGGGGGGRRGASPPSSSSGVARKRSRSPDKDRDRESGQRGREERRKESSERSGGDKGRARSPRSRSRSRSPPRRRQRTSIPRYSVSVPKIPLNFPSSCVADLRKRYTNMYVPSDFFNAEHVWNDSFPTHQPFKFQYGSEFHVFNKEQVELPVADPDAVFDPSDADHTWNAKVMLMAVPNPEELYVKTCQMGDSTFHSKESLVHPTRAIQFLVGVRGGSKDNAAAIGGPWSPSLDGEDPATNPAVLVKTAIRTCKALTGIDLSGCTKWCRFLEINYRRQESSSKPQRTETTVVFLPDIWSVMPSKEEFEKLGQVYSEALESKINPKPAKPAGAASDSAKKSKDEDKGETDEDELTEQEKELMEEEEGAEGVKDEEQEASGDAATGNGGTHWKELDPKSMKVVGLRSELQSRGLDTKGVKTQLAVRLQKALDEEEAKETEGNAEGAEGKSAEKEGEDTKDEKMETGEEEEEGASKEEKPASTEDGVEVMEAVMGAEKKKEAVAPPPPPKPVLDEKQKAALTAAYKLPDKPSILVHPHPEAKSGKFDVCTMSLSVLLDYRTDDNKEGTFEVSLFAELFNEMLMRDSAYKLYRALTDLTPEVAAMTTAQNADSAAADKKDKTGGGAAENEAGGDGEEETSATASSAAGATPAAKVKMVTRNKELLMACSYFDLGHGGYIEKKDVEDILQATTLCLSRAQIKKLVQKAAAATTTSKSKDERLNYRLFTDKPENEEPKPLDLKSEEEEKELALGFAAFLPTHKESSSGDQSEKSAPSTSGMCSYKGTVVDVGKLMSQLERSKQEKFDSEARLETTHQIVANLKEAAEKHVSIKEKLQNEVKELKKRLRTTEEDLKKVQGENFKFMNTINHVYNRVSPIATANLANLQAKQEQTETKSEVKTEDGSAHTNGNSTATKSDSDLAPSATEAGTGSAAESSPSKS